MRREKREKAVRARAQRTGKAPSILETMFARVGMRAGMRVGTFIAAWATAEKDIGHEISCDEYADWWKMARSTAFREQAAFRECFPEFETPTTLINACVARNVEPSLIGLREVEWSW